MSLVHGDRIKNNHEHVFLWKNETYLSGSNLNVESSDRHLDPILHGMNLDRNFLLGLMHFNGMIF